MSALLGEGKTKLVIEAGEERVLLRFKDTITAGDGVKMDILRGKGEVNARTSAVLFSKLMEAGIRSHYISQYDERTLLVRKLQMIPVEVVVRNVATGSIVKRLPIKEGEIFDPPIVEFFLKDDRLHDPLLNADHLRYLKLMSPEETEDVRRQALTINKVLKNVFEPKGLRLYDFKVEFGRTGSSLLLGDELTLDGMRVRVNGTGEVLDKDLYRRGETLERVMEAYLRFLKVLSS
ncbi:phosphoribosylaminoimidazolesuccinocarboxamide synthase [Sulfodiicoccus acidiphilus]|uniref:Phosphoribosylaminoimidazole-succinocarboxamide synthase n=1 Tax=Sulfodiicoccus acidiphilus TaxID=1670455 RepID=A0A348B0N3_9CREN|nr:phosphoribosylaminoimidazolesuccinocarboxamide synthase [Sulfodiicoccus acidiphilus]BBD71735.1 phosphoribosylaminoimidazolesuccinocarboxamide synthase [Sulfodiicoccus acidiphilus]GGT86243.1 phosphoribosylaminoimidazolesuccinocarboxamide synthase [Sulfodiicoccus acidiphilus]